jgi:hypothetical protein
MKLLKWKNQTTHDSSFDRVPMMFGISETAAGWLISKTPNPPETYHDVVM